jgi:Ni2+-binding GTPase involved in maturation of urease and hydrogenase
VGFGAQGADDSPRVVADRRAALLDWVEGDQETALDAERIRSTGCPVLQINTGNGCHLDAEMVAAGLRKIAPPAARC